MFILLSHELEILQYINNYNNSFPNVDVTNKHYMKTKMLSLPKYFLKTLKFHYI